MSRTTFLHPEDVNLEGEKYEVEFHSEGSLGMILDKHLISNLTPDGGEIKIQSMCYPIHPLF